MVFACPSCGNVVRPVNPGIAVLACDKCDTLLYYEDKVMRAGTRAILGEPRGPVAVGASGRVDGEPVEVVGRVRLSYDGGSWDEWYLGDRKGAPEWLVEDEKRYALEAPVPVPEGAHPGLALGAPLVVDGCIYEVREVGDAVLEGVEGQVPRGVEPGQVFRFVDLAEIDGSRVLLLEFDADGEAEAFAGTAVSPEKVELTGGRRRAPEAEVEAQTIRCPNCGAPYTPPTQGDPPVTAGCASCDAVLDLDPAQVRVVGHRDTSVRFDLEIGDRGELLDTTWEVVGRSMWMDDEGYRADEFLLWSEEKGYLWLENDNGHYAWTRPLEDAPSVAALETLYVGQKANFSGRAMVMWAKGRSRLAFVDGALPWRAQIGDSNEFVDFSAPPHVASVEIGPTEVEAFAGQWVPGRQLLEAFGREARWSRRSDVHIGQPNPAARFLPLAVVCLVLAVLNGVIILTAGGGKEVVRFTVPSGAVAEQSVESPPFTLDPADGAITTVAFQTQVDNSWVWVDMGLVDEETDQEFGYTGAEVEFYYGVEGGERWSEGSKSGSHSMKTPDAGTYYIDASLEYDRPTSADVRVAVGGRLSRYNIVLAVLFLFVGVQPFIGYTGFEKRRREDA